LKNHDSHLHWYGFLKLIPRKQLLLTTFYGTARILISAAWPYLLYHRIQKSAENSVGEILIGLLAVTVMFILSGLASNRQSLINIAIMEAFSLNLVERMWKKMVALEWLTFHGKNRVYYFDMLMVEAWRLRLGMVALLELLIVNGVIAGALTIFIAFISRPLFILCIGGLAFTAGLQFYSTIKIRPYLKHFHNAWRDQHHWIAKCVDQFDLVKMGRGYQESVITNKENTRIFLASNSAMLHCQSKWRAVNQVAGNMLRVVIFVTGIYWVQVHYVGLTDLLLVLLIVSIVQNNLMQVPGAVSGFMEGQEAAESISAFFSLPEEDLAQQPAINIASIETITIRDLAFSYDHKSAVNNINISLEKGKIYLWKGTNGSGKSTTAHVLLGLLNPQSGSLAINGLNMKWQNLKQLRKRFAFLNQDSPMFMGTLKENILFGHSQPQEAWDGVNKSWLAGLLPPGNNVRHRLVGDRGEGLSGGETKRIALMREWLRSSELLILDEPLNHLDEHAINEIKREILSIKNTAIIIIISHQTGFENIADEIKHF
jgi:ABC-type bacteriocin/lantibiotic exporter with double-glycine peptidase domain